MKLFYHLCLLCSLIVLSTFAKEKEADKQAPSPERYTEVLNQSQNRNSHALKTSKRPDFDKNKTPYNVVRVFMEQIVLPVVPPNPTNTTGTVGMIFSLEHALFRFRKNIGKVN